MKLTSAFTSKPFRVMLGMICQKTEISVQLHVHALALRTPWKSNHWTLTRQRSGAERSAAPRKGGGERSGAERGAAARSGWAERSTAEQSGEAERNKAQQRGAVRSRAEQRGARRSSAEWCGAPRSGAESCAESGRIHDARKRKVFMFQY